MADFPLVGINFSTIFHFTQFSVRFSNLSLTAAVRPAKNYWPLRRTNSLCPSGVVSWVRVFHAIEIRGRSPIFLQTVDGALRLPTHPISGSRWCRTMLNANSWICTLKIRLRSYSWNKKADCIPVASHYCMHLQVWTLKATSIAGNNDIFLLF